MADVFQIVKTGLIKELFEPEWQWIKDNRWNLANDKPEFLLLLQADKLSLRHLAQIKGWMDAEEKAKAEQEAKKVVRPSGASLTGGYIRQ